MISNKYTVYLLALFAGLGIGAISYFVLPFAYGVDSACYLEQARSFMTRGVFEVTPFAMNKVDKVAIPDPLFPPGYPLLIVMGSVLLRLPIEVAAPFLSLAALVILPVTIVFSFHRALGLWPAFWIGILVALTPAAVRAGYIAFSDTLSLVLVIYAVNRMLVAKNKVNWFWLGLLTGFAYLLRNANLGLLLSISLYLCWQLFAEPENRKEIIKNGLVWLGANALIIAPWLARNFLVFGKLQPYWMPPSTVSLGENIHDYLQAQLDTLLSFNVLDKLLVDKLWGIFLLLLLAALVTHQLITTWRRWQKIEQQTFFIASVYAVIGAAMVIVARTKYEWGVHIISRYALPFSCFILVALFIILKNTTFTINTRKLSIGLVMTLLITRAYELPKLYQFDQYHRSIIGAAAQIRTGHDVICGNLQGRLAVSNYAFVYRILCAAPVRHVFFSFQGNKLPYKSLQGLAKLGAKTGIVVSLFPYNFRKEKNLPLKKEKVMKLEALGWKVERNKHENLILSHKGKSSR